MEQKEVYLAPLAGYTDYPFRESCRAQGLKYCYTALIDAGALVYGNKDNEEILRRGAEEDWLGVQLLGSRLDFLEQAVPMLNELDFEELNFNMGCPVKKVVQRGSGAGLLLDEEHALACVKLLRKLTVRPLTVKLRILSETDVEKTVSFCRRLESEGVEGLTIHGRLASKVYSGRVATEVISAVRESVSIPVIANGGIFRVEDAEALQRESGCARVMVARGAIGNPWIFKSLLMGRDYVPTHGELWRVMDRHLRGMMSLYGEFEGLVNGRKIVMGYLGGRGYHRSLKLDVSQMKTSGEYEEVMSRIHDDKDEEAKVPLGVRLG